MKLRIPYLLATVVAVASCLYLADSRSLQAAPLASLETMEGKSVDLTVPDGTTRLITFWSPNCAISERNIPSLRQLSEQFTQEAFEVIAVAMPYSVQSEISAYIEKHDIHYPVAYDRSGEVSDAFPGVRFTPTTFLINGSGDIVWKHIGRMKGLEAEMQIIAALQPQQLARR